MDVVLVAAFVGVVRAVRRDIQGVLATCVCALLASGGRGSSFVQLGGWFVDCCGRGSCSSNPTERPLVNCSLSFLLLAVVCAASVVQRIPPLPVGGGFQQQGLCEQYSYRRSRVEQ